MRIISSILIAALIGIMVGGALAYWDVRSDPDALGKLADATTPSATSAGVQSGPRVVVPEPSYDFGTMPRGTSKSHEFVIRNLGTAALKLRLLSTTCKCTLSEVPNASIPPGGSTKVKLEWSA